MRAPWAASPAESPRLCSPARTLAGPGGAAQGDADAAFPPAPSTHPPGACRAATASRARRPARAAPCPAAGGPPGVAPPWLKGGARAGGTARHGTQGGSPHVRRAAAATSRGPRSSVAGRAGRALWFPTAGARARWGLCPPGSELTAARGGRAGPDGDLAALSLLPPAGLYKLGPRPPWSARLRASPRRPGAPRHPSLPRAICTIAGPPSRAGAGDLETLVRASPKTPTAAQCSHSHGACGALPPGAPGLGTRGGGNIK